MTGRQALWCCSVVWWMTLCTAVNTTSSGFSYCYVCVYITYTEVFNVVTTVWSTVHAKALRSLLIIQQQSRTDCTTTQSSEATAVGEKTADVTQQRRGFDLNDGEGRAYSVDCPNLCGTPSRMPLTR